MYRGAEVAEYTCGYFASSWSPLLFIAPEEYLSYGIGDVHNLTTKPIDPNTSRKEYKIQDHLGNTRVVLDGTGAIAGQYDYEPFGGVLWQSAPTPRLSFIDKEKDKESGLSEFGVRKYDDELGRFTSIDPWWEKYRSLTPYHYSLNNPLTLKDPSGYGDEDLDYWEVGKGVLAATVNDLTYGLVDFTKSGKHPDFKQGLEAGHMAVAVTSGMMSADLTLTAAGSGGLTLLTGGTSAPVTGTVAVVAGAGALYTGSVSAYAMGQYMEMKSNNPANGGESKKETVTFIQSRGENAVKKTVDVPDGYKKQITLQKSNQFTLMVRIILVLILMVIMEEHGREQKKWNTSRRAERELEHITKTLAVVLEINKG